MGGTFYNPNASNVFLKFYGDNSAVVGTTEPLYFFMVPGGGQIILDATTCYYWCINSLYAACTTSYTNGTAPTTPLQVPCLKIKIDRF